MDITKKIAIIGLGYVGLPLAVEFGKKYDVLGFDINEDRVKELMNGIDRTQESSADEIKASQNLRFSFIQDDLKDYNVFIITVPTPINQFKAPDLTPLIHASEMIGRVLKRGDIVIYESTVYPGCTEEDCVPVLSKASGLVFNKDFFCGYSPERINPGDKVNTLTTIRKITSGSTDQIANQVDALYASIITAGTYKAPSLKVAEAAKAIENAQRDLNISFVNELALIFDRIGIDTNDVIDAAATKWNFLKFKPGLVGGHCIGVDPYYLAHKAESLGYHPQVILSGRRVNDNMGLFIANKLIKLMIQEGKTIKGAKVLILGITFKENCPDIRNTRVIDIYQELKQFGLDVFVYDPWANPQEVAKDYSIELLNDWKQNEYEAIVLAVAHKEFTNIDFLELSKNNVIVYDTKAIIPRNLVKGRL